MVILRVWEEDHPAHCLTGQCFNHNHYEHMVLLISHILHQDGDFKLSAWDVMKRELKVKGTLSITFPPSTRAHGDGANLSAFSLWQKMEKIRNVYYNSMIDHLKIICSWKTYFHLSEGVYSSLRQWNKPTQNISTTGLHRWSEVLFLITTVLSVAKQLHPTAPPFIHVSRAGCS